MNKDEIMREQEDNEENIFFCYTCGKEKPFYPSAKDNTWRCWACNDKFQPHSRKERRHQPEHTWEPIYKKRK